MEEMPNTNITFIVDFDMYTRRFVHVFDEIFKYKSTKMANGVIEFKGAHGTLHIINSKDQISINPGIFIVHPSTQIEIPKDSSGFVVKINQDAELVTKPPQLAQFLFGQLHGVLNAHY